MRPPLRAIADNLAYSTEGRVWAVHRVASLPFAHRPVSARLSVHARLRSLLLGVPPDAMLLSVCERVDPDRLAKSMLSGAEPIGSPQWAGAVAATTEQLGEFHLFRRAHFLAYALTDSRSRSLQSVLASAAGGVGSGFGLPPLPVPEADIAARHRQDENVRARLGGVDLRPATTGEIRWLLARAVRRGLDEPFLDATWEPPERTIGSGTERRRAGPALAPLTDAVFTEGGGPDDLHRPRHRRYLRVESAGGVAFQAFLALADMPHEFAFPGGGGEWFHHLEAAPFPVDWCVRLRSVANAEAQVRIRRQHRQLLGQVDEYDGEVTGAPASLAEALEAVGDERAALAANPGERECQATVIFATWADDLAELETQAEALQAQFRPADYGLGRPTGGQLGLFRSMLPGTEPAPVCRDYTQFLLARDLAAGAPYCGTEVGDPTGLMLGASLDSGVFSPVLFDPAFGPRIDRSGSIGVCGVLGSGKSYLAKLLCWATLARGGQVVTLDRTATAEYVALAQVAPGSAQVVELGADAEVCLDPLRVFSGDDRKRFTLGFCTLLAGLGTDSLEAAALAEAVDEVAARADGRLGDVVDALRRTGERTSRPDPDALAAARRLSTYVRLGPAAVAFGTAPALRLDSDFVVFHAPDLALADRSALDNVQRGTAMLLPEQVFGQALLYLVAAVARRTIFADPTRFAAALFDEAWALTASPQGQALLLEGVRDGRKHNAACWLVSQSPGDLGPAELVDLLGSRFAFRQGGGATGAAQRFLGLEPDDATAGLLEGALATGQCLFRDVRDRVGVLQVLEAPVEALHDAFDTNPTRRAGIDTAQHPSAHRPERPSARPVERRTRRRVSQEQAAHRATG